MVRRRMWYARRPFSDGSRRMDEEAIRQRLFELQVEHRDLDDVVDRLVSDPLVDQLRLRRMKLRRLTLKDTIARYESMLIPDLDA